MKWAVGVTTVPSRRASLLPQTMNSLCDAGFDEVQLFADGCDDPRLYSKFGCRVTCRPNPPLKIVGNWMLSLWELHVRHINAERYAIFQDDIIAVKNLRRYREVCTFPKKGYLNLYTFNENKAHTKGEPGWHPSNQRGLGALGLVFDRDGVEQILGANHMVRKPWSAALKRGYKAVDGGILEAFKGVGWKEYVHNPSLVQHVGTKSTLENANYAPVASFPGEGFDAMDFIDGPPPAPPLDERSDVEKALEIVGMKFSDVEPWLNDTCCQTKSQRHLSLEHWAKRIVLKGRTDAALPLLKRMMGTT
jgi:hypothetical protein